MDPRDSTPLVTRAALQAFVQRLVEHFALVAMPFEGKPRERVEALLAAGAATPMRNPVVEEWIARAERHWRMAELLPDLSPGYLSGLFQVHSLEAVEPEEPEPLGAEPKEVS